MNTTPKTHRRNSGFTLVEMIGVLAVIAILASMIVPRVFQAIGDAKINSSASTANNIKAGINEYYAKYGRIGDAAGGVLTLSGGVYNDWDSTVLLAGGFIEKPFSTRIGNGKVGQALTGTHLRVLSISANATTDAMDPSSMDDGRYDLDGSGAQDVIGSLLIEAVIPGVDLNDASAFNERLDGKDQSGSFTNTTTSAVSTVDVSGRVKYGEAATDGTVTVHVYMAHK